MTVTAEEKPALLVIDMVKDNFDPRARLKITAPAMHIIEPINRVLALFHEHRWPVVFATDAFRKQDFIFKARMQPHSLAGSKGAEVIDELDRTPRDIWLPKPRFSASPTRSMKVASSMSSRTTGPSSLSRAMASLL